MSTKYRWNHNLYNVIMKLCAGLSNLHILCNLYTIMTVRITIGFKTVFTRLETILLKGVVSLSVNITLSNPESFNLTFWLRTMFLLNLRENKLLNILYALHGPDFTWFFTLFTGDSLNKWSHRRLLGENVFWYFLY